MQLSQRSDDSPKDKDDQDHEQPVSPVVHAPIDIPPEAAAATTPSGSGPTPPGASPEILASQKTQTVTKPRILDAKLPDVTPRRKAPRQPSVFVPATPSQNKILHKDVFGSCDTDLSELSNDSEVDSMKILSQKAAMRADSMIAITKQASIPASAVPSTGAPGKRVAERRILDSDDEEVLSNPRKGAKGNGKLGTGEKKKAFPAFVVSDVEDDIPPPPAPFKSKASRILVEAILCLFFVKGEHLERPKSTKKNPGDLDEISGPLVRDSDSQKRKRKNNGDDDDAAGISDIQDKPPPVKRARKTAGGKPNTIKPKAISRAPPPTPPRDSQVLKKVPHAAKKNANYGGRTKAARTSPGRNSTALPDDDDLSDVLELKTRSVDPRVEPPLVGDGDDDYASSPPVPPKPKLRSKAAAKPKSMPAGKSVPPEKSKTAAMKTKAKTQTGARTRAAATKAKGAGDVKVVKTDPPQKAKAKAKKKPEALSADEGESKGGKAERGKVELAKNSPAVIEVFSSPPEPPKAILSKRIPISRVTSKEVFFNSFRCIHASLIVALIVHSRNMLQSTLLGPKNQQRTVPYRRRSASHPGVRKILESKRLKR